AAQYRARLGPRDVLRVHPALYDENAPGVSYYLAVSRQQNRGRDHRDVARRSASAGAGHLLLAIQTRDVGALSSAPATSRVPSCVTGRFHGMDDVSHRRPADP